MTSLLGGRSSAVSDRSLDPAARLLAAVTATLGIGVLLAWIVEPSLLEQASPGSATTKVNTALSFIALAATLLTRHTVVVAVLAGAVAATGLASLWEYLFDVQLGIDELFVRDELTAASQAAGRMGPATAVSLILLAAARLAHQRRAERTAQLLVAPVLAIGAVALLGYLYQVEEFYTFVAYSSLALPTAVGVILLGLGVACLVPGGVVWRVVKDPGPGATLARHTLPLAILAVPLLGVLPLLGVYTDLFGERYGIALVVAATAALLMAATAVAARRLDRTDRERLAAQDGLRRVNDQLRERRDLEWRRAESLSRSLGEERARFQRAIGKIDDLIWTLEVMPDGALRPEFSSGDASGLFGGEQPGGDERSRAVPDLTHPDDREILAAFDDKIRSGLPAEAEVRIVGYDGVVRWAWVRATPRRERSQLFADGISTNVTDRHQLAERRENLLALEQEQVRKLKQLNQLREELLAVTGHELRTPLSVILGYAELLLQEDGLTGVQRRHLEVMANRSRQVALLVEDIFDLAKFSAGLASIDARPVALADAVAEAVEEHRPSAAAAGITIDQDLTEVTVAADPARLRQILDNLLSNAIKYSMPGGAVGVTAQCEGGIARIAVSDGGIGIPEGELEHVFDRMYRATSAKDRDIQGTGLGLSVAKALVEAHGGTISVANRPEGGTRFTVEIPVRHAPIGSGTNLRKGEVMAEEYWFCLKHHTVEGAEGCKSADRLGPYATADEAGRALDKVAERNESWDSDPAWNDDVAARDD